MNEVKTNSGAKDWLEAELEDTLDEDYELEISEPALSLEIARIYKKSHPPSIERTTYFRELLRLQSELIKLQSWVAYHKKKLVVIFEGRDSAGKGGVIKRITQRLNPRICRVVALPAPTERERSQWYFQRYVPHLPAGGEIVLFDRSWYNRSGVEQVMGFANADQVEEFFRDVPEFERMLVRSGITLVKYWFSITDEEQQMRFLMRIHDPMKQWKLSPMDLQSRVRWEQYTKAKEETFARTNIKEAPWFIVEGNDKKRARLNCIDHLLQQMPYEDVPHEEITLPERLQPGLRAPGAAARALCAGKVLSTSASPTGEKGEPSLRAPDHHMRRVGGRDLAGAAVAELRHVQPGEKMLAGAEQDRRDREMHLVDQAFLQILPDRGDAAADPHILVLGGRLRLFERRMDAVGDEVKRRAAFHQDRRPLVMGEHEDRHVIGRVVAPPAFPALVRPFAADRPEHVATKDPGADILKTARGEAVAAAGGAAVFADHHLTKGARADHPFMQSFAADAERAFESLIGAGAVTVQRQGESVDAQL